MNKFLVKKKLVKLRPRIDIPFHTEYDIWKKLENKTILNSNILIEKFGNLDPLKIMDSFYEPKFKAKRLFLNNCNSDFLSYWLNTRIFEDLEEVYLGSNLCSTWTFYELYHYNIKTYINFQHPILKERWSHNMINIKLISEIDYINLLNQYEEEELKIEHPFF